LLLIEPREPEAIPNLLRVEVIIREKPFAPIPIVGIAMRSPHECPAALTSIQCLRSSRGISSRRGSLLHGSVVLTSTAFIRHPRTVTTPKARRSGGPIVLADASARYLTADTRRPGYCADRSTPCCIHQALLAGENGCKPSKFPRNVALWSTGLKVVPQAHLTCTAA